MCNSASWPSGRACPRPPAGTLDAAPALPTPPWHPTADQTRFLPAVSTSAGTHAHSAMPRAVQTPPPPHRPPTTAPRRSLRRLSALPPSPTHTPGTTQLGARGGLRVQPEAPSPTRTQAPRCWQTWELSVQHPRPPGTHDVGGTNPGPGQRGTHAPWHTPGPAQTARSRKPPAGALAARAGPRRRPGQIRETRSVPTLSPQVAIPWRPVAPRPASGGTP